MQILPAEVSMIAVSINWLAVLVCLVFNVVCGSLWFGPKTFFPVWWRAIGKTDKEPAKGTPLTWILLILAGIFQAIFVAVAVNALKINNIGMGVLLGFIIWVGFVAPTGLAMKLFPGQLKAWVIESSYHLINFLVFGAILGVWHKGLI